ncbi:type VI secretion system-associated FHA domain protein TagH [Pseudoxanthomonas putridarboris]|uniref:Type VI secretion system-associated FHA domain protein TagH n=1 Tax=Pseudoxanthomonas putridarboris TaxID=752605 RepID=A0ABU9J650_9GAMM
MNSQPVTRQIHLVVANPEVLEFGSRPSQVFDMAGGTIGSRGANWQLSDIRGGVAPIHTEIMVVDGAYCVVDRSGRTWVNDAADPLGPERIVRLNDGDVVRVGPYRINVSLDESGHASTDPTRHLGQQSLGEILNDQDSQFDRLSEPAAPMSEHGHGYGIAQDELSAFAEPSPVRGGTDPLAALDAAARQLEAKRSARAPLDRIHYGLSNQSVIQADLADTNFEAVSNVTLARGGARPMDNEHSASRPMPWRDAIDPANAEGLHVALIPLGQGLGIPLGHLDSEQAHHLLYEAGRALKAAVEGISALYAEAPHNGRGPGLLNRTLQPIEDNPLRLQRSYEDTANALFSGNRSPVHLAPQAAVSESLGQVAKHNEAIAVAVKSALGALLGAFSPEALEKRFERYAGVNQGQQDAGWLWNMYGHYFEELMSSRQQGFDKLFWEVFDQAYDRAMRSGD